MEQRRRARVADDRDGRTLQDILPQNLPERMDLFTVCMDGRGLNTSTLPPLMHLQQQKQLIHSVICHTCLLTNG